MKAMRATFLATVVILLSACGASSQSATVRSSSASAKPAKVEKAPVTTTTTTTTTTTALLATPQAPAESEYEEAKDQWLGSGLYEGSAGQNAALPIAINDLKMGELTDPGDKSGYPTAIANLTTIAHMPDAMSTPQEMAQWNASAAALDTFFALPYTTPYNVFAPPAQPPYNVNCGGPPNTATAAWNEEPSGNSSGVLIEPLKQAAADIEQQKSLDPCYPAAIDDLVALQSASKEMIAHSNTATWNSGSAVLAVACEIGYLNQLFEAEALNPANDRLF
jgi:hypothetical protein